MSLIGVFIGSVFQLFLALFLFMLIGMGAGAGNRSVLTVGIIIAPSSCFVSAGAVIYKYNIGGSSSSYWWYVMPLMVTVCVVALAIKLK